MTKRILLPPLFLCLLCLPAGPLPPAASPAELGERLGEHSLYDTKRRLHALGSGPAGAATVLVFASTECPLANLYLPALGSLEEEYRPKGVRFLLVNADPGDSFLRVAGHAWDREIGFPVLKDFEQELARALGAERTPEAFVLDRDWRLRYRGRIDDRYTVTHRRAAPSSEELRAALEALLSDSPVPVPRTAATGCLIDYSGNPYAEEPLTWGGEIASIVESRCLECHRKGGIGQIALDSYARFKRFSGTIREVVSEERMPPWHADPHYGSFSNDRSLGEGEKERLLAWIDQGCPEGRPRDFEPEPEEGWTIGAPDRIFSLPEEQAVPADGVVDYRYFRVDPGFEEDVWVQAAEARPGNREVVHHILVYVVGRGEDAYAEDGDTRALVGWAPGDMPKIFPPGVASRIPAGKDLVFEMHYTPNGAAATDRSSVGLRFAPAPPEREVRTNIMWQRGLKVPPGEPWHTEQSTMVFERDSRILFLMPHMHLRGIAARYRLDLPDGTSRRVLSVPYYDFNWQSVYRFEEPLRVPAGATLTITGAWDNSPGNPSNPDPSQEVLWGNQTWDEMLNGWINYVHEEPVGARSLTGLEPPAGQE